MFKSKTIQAELDLLQLRALNPQRYPYLLQSVACDGHNNVYDIAFGFAQQSLVLRDDGTLLFENTSTQETTTQECEQGDFLQRFDQWSRELHSTDESHSELPFYGGWVMFLGYELAAQIEPSLKLPATDDGFPIAFAARVPSAVIYNRASKQLSCVAEVEYEAELDALINDVEQCLQNPKQATTCSHDVRIIQQLEEDARQYYQGIDRIKRYIVEGDVFQVNLSRRWQIDFDAALSAECLYERLRTRNPAPFAALISYHDKHIVSSSPERLVQLRNNRVSTRPIAGTRPRGRNAAADRALLEELIAHPKERAEHIMLIDLGRNDLGRVCRPGSIHVDELMCLESYAHVHHIVSNVTGSPRLGVSPVDILRAVFPGGTITGCPKLRCMEIIAELEGMGRGAYTGSIGYINRDGSMDFNILIRTMSLWQKTVRLRAGAGIVHDSDAHSELLETRAKARGMLQALGK